MKLICGLGNPGMQYIHTRHNIGFLFLDHFTHHFHFPPFTHDKKHDAHTSEGFIPCNTDKIILLKPQTFMNRSGIAIASVMQFYKISPSDLIIVHDDLDITLGKYKVSHDTRAAGHNGVQNIINVLGTQDFMRIRIGIESAGGKKERGHISGEAYVLQDLSSAEQETCTRVYDEIIAQIFCIK